MVLLWRWDMQWRTWGITQSGDSQECEFPLESEEFVNKTYGSALIALQFCSVRKKAWRRRTGWETNEQIAEPHPKEIKPITVSKRASRYHLRIISGAMLSYVTAWYMPKTSQFLSEFLRLVILCKKFKLIIDPKIGLVKGVKPFYHSEVECLGEKWFISSGQSRLPPGLQVSGFRIAKAS